jgi:hypothetical protein
MGGEMFTLRRTAKLLVPALLILGAFVLLSQEAGRGIGPGRFDRFTLHNLTKDPVPVAVEVTRTPGDPVVKTFSVRPFSANGIVLLETWDVTKVKCTVSTKSVTITADSGKYIEWATFWYGESDFNSGTFKRCGHGLQTDGKMLLSGPEQ